MRSTLLCVAAFATTAWAAVGDPCHNGHTPGVCVTTTECTAANGTYQSGNCPGDPSNVQCCQKTKCDTGECRWTTGIQTSCSGATKTGLCPGPAGFKCCLAHDTWSRPSIPTSNCEAKTEASGAKILNNFPGSIVTVYCYRPSEGPSDTSDHPKGLALDLMVGTYNPKGFDIAEWVMNNQATLDVKYVMWGQKIWSKGIDGSPKPWENWRGATPYDRGSITANHWDHVHVSFNA